MGTRIRYTRSDTGFLVSKPLLANRGTVTLNLDESTLTLTVVSFDTGEILETLTSDTLVKLKTLAKKRVVELGAVFSDEVRASRHSTTEATTEDVREAS